MDRVGPTGTTGRPGLGRPVLLGFAVAGAGGPLCLFALYLAPSSVGGRAGLLPTTLAGLVLFAAAVAVWRGYSRVVASDAGQYAFVERAWGVRAARVQGIVWTVAYLLYLPYTVTYIVFYLLPALWALPPWASDGLSLALPIGICLLVGLGDRAAVLGVAAMGAVQLAALAAVAVLALARPPAAPGAPLWHLPALTGLPAFAAGAAAVSFLLVCMSLVLYLGGESADGGGGIRWSLLAGYGTVGIAALLAAAGLAHGLPSGRLSSAAAGLVVARVAASPDAALALGVLVMAATAALIVAEFLALKRLWRTLFRLPDRRSVLIIAAFFVASDAASLVNPWRFYTLAIAPSLVALYLSQAIVFAAYPSVGRPASAGGRAYRSIVPWLAAAVATLAALWGLYQAALGLGALFP